MVNEQGEKRKGQSARGNAQERTRKGERARGNAQGGTQGSARGKRFSLALFPLALFPLRFSLARFPLALLPLRSHLFDNGVRGLRLPPAGPFDYANMQWSCRMQRSLNVPVRLSLGSRCVLSVSLYSVCDVIPLMRSVCMSGMRECGFLRRSTPGVKGGGGGRGLGGLEIGSQSDSDSDPVCWGEQSSQSDSASDPTLKHSQSIPGRTPPRVGLRPGRSPTQSDSHLVGVRP
eukprot:gene8117-biopygen12112